MYKEIKNFIINNKIHNMNNLYKKTKFLSFMLFVIIIMTSGTREIFSQPSTANYSFTNAANGSLIDMSSGTIELIGANSSTATSALHSTVQDIGFNFVFMGNIYSQFGVSSRGTLKFGSASSGAISANNLNTTNTTFLPLVAPFWDAMGTSSTGKVHYKVIGSAPNRVLVVEWLNMRIGVTTSAGSTTADGTFQLLLYETTGKMEFIYGSMNIGSGSPVVTASIGFSVGNSNNSLLSVTSITSPAVTTLTGSVNNSLVNTSSAGWITGLNSLNNTQRVIYTFTPPSTAPTAPTNLTFNGADNSMILNWTDNASNETGFIIENVNDGVSYSVSANMTQYVATGLSTGTNYTFRIYAVNEGMSSTPLQGSGSTTNSSNIITSGAYSFTHLTNGSLTDMSSGTTEVIGANSSTANNFAHSSIQEIGFNFAFMGQMYNKFGVSSRGTLRFGAASSDGIQANNLNTTTANFLPLVAPFWDAMGTSSSGKVHYKVTGTVPNRVLVIEWLNMRIGTTASGGSNTADGTFQLRLYETTGKMEFVYGSMNIGSGSPVVSASIGFTIGNSINNLLSVKSISSPILTAVPGSVNNSLVNSSTPGQIEGLNSASNGQRIVYSFTPPASPNAPTNLSFTGITDNSITLNWTDNAINEKKYIIENVNDGLFYSLSANTSSYNITGLSTGTNYSFRIYAISEGSSSSALEGSQATTNTGNILTAGAYNFLYMTNGSLTDMSSGTTQLIGANSSTSGTDMFSTIQSIEFPFIFMGQIYNTFGVSSLGGFRFEGVFNTSIIPNLNTSTASQLPLVAPFGALIGTSSSGKVHYKVTGTAPNRTLIVEWLNMRIGAINPSGGSTTPDGTFQLRLYETSGKIEFVYGSMNIGAGSPVVAACIGFTTGNSASNLLSVRSLSIPGVSAVPAGVNSNLVSSFIQGPIPGLNSNTDGQRVVYSFTPVMPSSPTSLSFSNVTNSSMTLNWTPAVNAKLSAIYMSTDNFNFTYITSVPAAQNSYNAINLNPSTTYYWRIYSLTEGGISTPLESSQITNNGTYTGGTKTIGAGGDYATLQAAFNDINTQGLTGAVLLELQGSYNPALETYPINPGSLPGSSASNSVTVRPASGVTNIVFSNDTLQTFRLDVTKYLTIDGRPGGTGITSELMIQNVGSGTDTSGNFNTDGNAILFINGASNNTIKYCTIKGINPNNLQGGVIAFSNEGGITGNDKNIIDNCTIRDGAMSPANNMVYPANLVFVGGGASTNDSISIINCRLYNNSTSAIFFRSSGSSYGDGHIVSGNSIYRTLPTSGSSSGINFNLVGGTGKGHIITNNFIGGSDVNCGGAPFNTANSFTGISFAGSSSLISNNTIQNITTGSSTFSGIVIDNDKTDNVISNNTIGHKTVANSILGNTSMIGIQLGSVSNHKLSGNLIANISSSNRISGITLTSGSALNNVLVEGNIVHSLTSTSTTAANNFQSAVNGIGAGTYLANSILKGNIIYGLVSVPSGAGTANTSVLGIVLPGSSVSSGTIITSNSIFGLVNASIGTAPNIYGISTADGLSTVASGTIINNQITLTNAGSPNAMNIRGININAAGPENIWNVYYNSINIGGEVFDGLLVSSALYKQNTGTINLRNNLFYNSRTGGTGGHYASAFENNTNITSDYNLFVAPSNVALWGAIPYSFANYKANSGLDGFSYSTDPTILTTANLFVDAANGNLNVNAGNNAAYYVDGKGIPITGISGDFGDTSGVRNTLISQGTTDIGSDEFEYSGAIPDITASGPPALNTTTTYSFAGRQLGSIAWGNTGSVPSSLVIKYNSGVNPPGTLTGEYSKAFWDIIPTGGSGYTYDITLNYSPAVLFNISNGNNIKISKRDSQWDYIANATVNTTNKTATATGLNSFSQFALTSSDAPLPIELASFTSMTIRNEVILDWSTSSEINNASFEIERSPVAVSDNYQRIGSIQGNGTTNEVKKYKFNDRNLQTGKYKYRLKQIDFNGNFNYFNLSGEVEVGIPGKYDLSQNYPNPFNPVTKINYDMPKDGKVNLRIYDITGREIAALINNELQPAGYYTVIFNASNLSSGVYFYRIVAGDFVATKKLMLIK